MANDDKEVKKATQLQGKLQTIKDHADWILSLKDAWFSQRALYNAVMRGGLESERECWNFGD